jgi:outer membrane protein
MNAKRMLLLVAAAWPVGAAAQMIAPLPMRSQAADGGAELSGPDTLGRAIADAYRSNPDLEAQRAGLRSADEAIIQAGAPYRLNASLNADFDYLARGGRQGIDRFDTVRQRGMGLTLSASQILINGGRTAAQVSVAEAASLAGRERLRQVENAILYEVVDAYLSVRRDQALIGIQRRSLDSYGRQVDQAVARERGGDLTRTDIAQARAQREIIRAQLAQAEANLQNSRARFAVAVGRNPGALSDPPTLPGLPASLEAAYRIAEKESPALWQATLAARSGDARIAAERAERAPVVALTGSVGYANTSSYRIGDLRPQATGGVSVTMPLLTGGIIGSRVRAAVADRQRLGFEVEAARRGALAATQEAWNQSVAATEQQAAGSLATEAAETALTGVRRSFAEGFRSNFEVLDSEQRLLTAQLVATNAAYANYTAQARLLATLGRLQASLVEQGVPAYDPDVSLRRARSGQVGSFEAVLAPLDRAQMPSGAAPPAPRLAYPTDTDLRSAEVTMLPPPLGTALPIAAPLLAVPGADDLADGRLAGG